MTAAADLQVDGAGLRINGELRFDTVTALLKKLTAAIAGSAAGCKLQLDLAGVSRTDSAGLALLLEVLALAHRSGRALAVYNAPAALRTLANISEVESILLPQQALAT